MNNPKQKAAITLAQAIVRTIHAEGLKPGDRYLCEGEALKRHGVARATFREALRFLEIQGVIEVRAGPKGGAIVSRPDWTSLASTLALLLQFESAALEQVLVARCVLEPGMARLVAEKATDEEIAAMGAAIAGAAASISDFPAFYAHYQEFWSIFAAATHNAVLKLLSPALRAIVNSGGFVPDEVRRAMLVEWIGTLHQAVASRDPELAQRRLETLENAFLERLRTGYPSRIARPVAWSDVRF